MKLTDPDQAELRAALMEAFPGIPGVTKLIMALQAIGIDIAWDSGSLFAPPEFAFSMRSCRKMRGRIENVIGAARRTNRDNSTLAALEAKWLKTAAAEEHSRLEAMVVAALN